MFDSHREQQEGESVQMQLAFIEFTTGTPHPLSPTHTVLLPLFSTGDGVFTATKFLGDDGDYILVSAWKPSYVVVFYLVAWKTGIVTFVSGRNKFCLSLTHADFCSSANSRTCVGVQRLLL